MQWRAYRRVIEGNTPEEPRKKNGGEMWITPKSLRIGPGEYCAHSEERKKGTGGLLWTIRKSLRKDQRSTVEPEKRTWTGGVLWAILKSIRMGSEEYCGQSWKVLKRYRRRNLDNPEVPTKGTGRVLKTIPKNLRNGQKECRALSWKV